MSMSRCRLLKSFVQALFCLVLLTGWLRADTICDEGNGPLNPAQPNGINSQEIIQKLAAKESVFREARNNYTYTQDITVQTLEGNTVDGEWHQVWDITDALLAD